MSSPAPPRRRTAGYRRCVDRATTASQPRNTSAVLQHHILIRLGELLAAHRHHVGHRVQVNGLVLMGNSAPDVVQFQCDLAGQLALKSDFVPAEGGEFVGKIWVNLTGVVKSRKLESSR